MQELFDIGALVDNFPTDSIISKLKQPLRSALSAVSVSSDLKRALELIEICKKQMTPSSFLSNSPYTREEAVTFQAQFMQAISLYARATHNESNGKGPKKGAGRNKLQITNFLKDKPDLRALHTRVTSLRDEYFAHHVDSTGWENRHVVLALDLEKHEMSLSYPSQTVYIRPADIFEFEPLFIAAYDIATEQQKKMSKKLYSSLNSIFDEQPEVISKMRKNIFQPEQFFGEGEAVSYRAGMGKSVPNPHSQPTIDVILNTPPKK